MKSMLLLAALSSCTLQAIAQEKGPLDSKKFLSMFSNNACQCVDSINVSDKSRAEVAKEISACIDKQVMVYQMSDKLLGGMDLESAIKDNKTGGQKKNISIDVNQNSDEYKQYYYNIERYMMDSCQSIKIKIASDDKVYDKSVSDNPKAVEFYNAGLRDMQNQKYQDAKVNFEKALKVDPLFSFAWDNLGMAYRKMEQFDKAIDAYKSSLKINPNGTMPLQNIAVAYEFKNEYDKAIEAYERLAKLDKENPEIYYGIGRIYAAQLQDYETGLDYMCKAYNLYTKQKSPYRSDAENVMVYIYQALVKQGKEEKFNQILEANNISR